MDRARAILMAVNHQRRPTSYSGLVDTESQL